MLSVVDCITISKAGWSDFVLSHPDGNIFQSPEYSELCSSYPLYEAIAIAVTDNDIIKGVLVGVIQKEYPGLAGRLTARAVVMGGPLAAYNDHGIASLLAERFIQLTGGKVLFSQYRNLFDTGPFEGVFRQLSYSYEEHLDILIPLNRPVGEILASFHPTRRKQIGRAYRRGITVEAGIRPDKALMNECMPLLKDTYRRTGLPLPEEVWFSLAADILGKGCMLKIFVARVGSELAGFRMVLCYNRCLRSPKFRDST